MYSRYDSILAIITVMYVYPRVSIVVCFISYYPEAYIHIVFFWCLFSIIHIIFHTLVFMLC